MFFNYWIIIYVMDVLFILFNFIYYLYMFQIINFV